jgi:hypothetical protein
MAGMSPVTANRHRRPNSWRGHPCAATLNVRNDPHAAQHDARGDHTTDEAPHAVSAETPATAVSAPGDLALEPLRSADQFVEQDAREVAAESVAHDDPKHGDVLEVAR